MSRPYKLTRGYRPRGAATIPDGATIASYETLAAAVAGARRAFVRTADDSLEIRAAGRTLRCLYHHGIPTDPRWDVEVAS